MASQGPLSAGTGADDAGNGTLVWANPGNITLSDDSRATCTGNLFSTETSHYLVATNFGFSIPSGATIDGIVAEWERSDSNSPLNAVVDARVQLVQGGAIGGNNNSAGATWAHADQYDSFGSSSDLWGLSWTDTDINASDFGVALSANVDGSAQARVDHCRITVYYTAAASDVYPLQSVQSRSLPTPQARSRTANVIAPSVLVEPVAEAWSLAARASPPALKPASRSWFAIPTERFPPFPDSWLTKSVGHKQRAPWLARSWFTIAGMERLPPFPDSWLSRFVGKKLPRPRLNRSWFAIPSERLPPEPDSWLTRMRPPVQPRRRQNKSVALFQLVPYANDPISPWFNSRRVVMPKTRPGRTTVAQLSAQEVLPFNLPMPFVQATPRQQKRISGRRALLVAGQPTISPLPGVLVGQPIQRLRRGSTRIILNGEQGTENALGGLLFVQTGKTLPRRFVPSATITRILEPYGTGILPLGFLQPRVARPVVRLGFQQRNSTRISWTLESLIRIRIDNRNATAGRAYGSSSTGLGSRNQSSTGNT